MNLVLDNAAEVNLKNHGREELGALCWFIYLFAIFLHELFVSGWLPVCVPAWFLFSGANERALQDG